jgi:predicted MFS family arabinose efflux permease
MSVSRLSSYLQREHSYSLERFLLISYLFFAGSFFIIGFSGQWLLMLYVSVAVFTFGEMLFTPMSSTIASSMAKPGKRVLYFNALNVSQALGEGLGVYIGVAVLNLFIAAGHGALYWHLLGAFGVIAALLVRVTSLPARSAQAAGQS